MDCLTARTHAGIGSFAAIADSSSSSVLEEFELLQHKNSGMSIHELQTKTES